MIAHIELVGGEIYKLTVGERTHFVTRGNPAVVSPEEWRALIESYVGGTDESLSS